MADTGVTAAALEEFFLRNLDDDHRVVLDLQVKRLEHFLETLDPVVPGIAFITSGGTSVPLERSPVRYLTNFSSGGRGAYFTEAFVDRGWGCVLLRHKDAVRPFRRVLDALPSDQLFGLVAAHASKPPASAAQLLNQAGPLSSDDSFSASKAANAPSAAVPESTTAAVAEMEVLYRKSRGLLVEVLFDTVVEYLYLLRALSQALCGSGTPRSVLETPLIFLAAAAVSDYYMPLECMSREKISGGDGLNLRLENVPKILSLLHAEWLHRQQSSDDKANVPQPFIVSFKLETSDTAMRAKAIKNLHLYQCDAVVANLLASYKEKVLVYLHDGDDSSPSEIVRAEGKSIESSLADFFTPLARAKRGTSAAATKGGEKETVEASAS